MGGHHSKSSSIEKETTIEERQINKIEENDKLELVLSVLPYLQVKDLISIGKVSKNFNKEINKNEIAWHSLCKRDFQYPSSCAKLSSHSWKDVYIQMVKHKEEMKEEEERYKKRKEAWAAQMMHVACGMRAGPPIPRFFKLENTNKNTENFKVGGFKEHPGTKVERVLNFSKNLLLYSKILLDLLFETSKHSEFNDNEFLSQALKKYQNFLHLKRKYKNKLLIPTMDIEYIWVSHMLRPSMYIKDCLQIFGEVIDHDIIVHSSYEWTNKGNALKETRELYQNEFGGQYCSDRLIEDMSKLPLYNIEGIGPLYPPLEPQKPDSGHYFRAPKKSVLIQTGASFAPGFESEPIAQVNEKLISLTVTEVRMDGEWLHQFQKYMKIAVDWSLNTMEILDTSQDYTANPCRMTTNQIYTAIWKAYEKFLYMAAKYPPGEGKYIHPTYAIDVIWHAHMINPISYAKEVKEWVGYLVDHDPWPECQKTELDKNVANTEDLWKKEFGLEIDSEHVVKTIPNEPMYDLDGDVNYLDWEL